MFYQISDILLCHEFFLEQLESRVDDWHDKQKIGDILVASVWDFVLLIFGKMKITFFGTSGASFG